MNFTQFKSRPARAMFAKLGIAEILDAATSWSSLRASAVALNGGVEGRFVALARRVDGVASSGERVLLHAVCYACDFAWLADELSDCHAWRRMDYASGEWRAAVAACIALEE